MRATSRKPARPRRSRFSIAPVILASGLVVGHQLLTRLVPMVWGSMLPGGLMQARTFRGWAGLVWNVAVWMHGDFAGTAVVLGSIAGVGFLVAMFARPLRPLVWLAAVAVIGLDAGIVYVALRAAIEATAMNAGIM